MPNFAQFLALKILRGGSTGNLKWTDKLQLPITMQNFVAIGRRVSKIKLKLKLKPNKELVLQLRGVICHIGSHSVTCHPTQVNAPRPALIQPVSR